MPAQRHSRALVASTDADPKFSVDQQPWRATNVAIARCSAMRSEHRGQVGMTLQKARAWNGNAESGERRA